MTKYSISRKGDGCFAHLFRCIWDICFALLGHFTHFSELPSIAAYVTVVTSHAGWADCSNESSKGATSQWTRNISQNCS